MNIRSLLTELRNNTLFKKNMRVICINVVVKMVTYTFFFCQLNIIIWIFYEEQYSNLEDQNIKQTGIMIAKQNSMYSTYKGSENRHYLISKIILMLINMCVVLKHYKHYALNIRSFLRRIFLKHFLDFGQWRSSH